MPKNKKDAQEQSQDERFRDFFTTSVADIPLEMTQEYEEKEPKNFFERIFGRGKAKDEQDGQNLQELFETGELPLGVPENEPVADLELAETQEEAAKAFFEPDEEPEPQKPVDTSEFEALFGDVTEEKPEAQETPQPVVFEQEAEPRAAEPEQPVVFAGKPELVTPVAPEPEKSETAAAAPEPEKTVPEPEKPAPAVREPAKPQPEPQRQSAPEPPAPQKRSEPERQQAAAPAAQPERLSPQEEQEGQELAELRAMLRRLSGSEPQPPKPAAKPAASGDEEIVTEADTFFSGNDKTLTSEAPESGQTEELDMELPLDGAQPEPVSAEPAAAQPEAAAEPETAQETPEEKPAAEPETIVGEAVEEAEPASIAERLKKMRAVLILRCVLSGILAVMLLHFDLVAESLVSPVAGLDPIVARTAFYGVNLLLYIAAMGVGYTVVRDGMAALRNKKPNSETMPAMAAWAGLLQALIASINSKSYQPSSLTLLTGIAAFGLFMALLGELITLIAASNAYALLNSGVEHFGAYRARSKDLIRSLARDLEQKDPWILLSATLNEDEDLVERCFDEHAGERRTRRFAYALLIVACISGLLFLIFGAGINGCIAALTAVLCMGSPFSSTLIAGVAALRLQHSAAAVGAVVPGWAAVEELGGIDTIQVDAEELFPPECAQLEDIRMFEGGRVDRAILYAASILNAGCNTLRGLFRQIIEERTDILFPVKDMETHRGKGFSAWCDNNHMLLGTRAYLESEGVPMPDEAYENKYTKNGELQALYLAVSGSLHAMFLLRYKGGRHAAHSLETLQRENIRLLVSCQDPSLTARHIAEAYRLPDGMVTLLDAEQCGTVEAEAHELSKAPCCMVHLKGLASLTGGLRAAEQAQNAETAATTVQLVSVAFSAAIGVLLTSAGSIGAMSVVSVLMYQAAWSALSLAVCVLKQYR